MGFFSSLFGSSRSSEPSSTVVQASTIPKEIAPYMKEVLEGYQDLYKNQLERGYQEYGGQTIAPLTGAQESALSGLEGLRGATQPMYEAAAEKAIGAGQQFTPETAQQYMSPYQQAVTDIELREADRRFQGTTMPNLEAQAVNMGAMSGLGSRAGIEMAEAQRGQNQLLSDIQTKGQQKSFDAATKQFESERERERMVGQDLSQLAGQGLTSQITELGAQKAVGEERQQLGQLGLDEAYRKYLEKEEFPETALTTYSGGVYGNPMSRTYDQTQNTFGAQPSTGQSLLSLGLSGLGMYGMGKNIYNKSKEGGYVGQGLPTVYRQTNDQVGTGDDNRLAIWDTISGVGDYIRKALEVSPETKAKVQLQNAKDLQRNPSLALMGPAPVSTNQLVSPKAAEVMNQLAQADKGRLNPLETAGEKKVRESLVENLQGKQEEVIAKEEEQINISEGSKYTTADDLPQDEREGIINFNKEVKDSSAPVSIDIDTSVEDKPTTDKSDIDKTKKTSLTGTQVVNRYIADNDKLQDMVNKKIISIGELQTQLKDAIKADKTGTKESRNRSNELSFWRSLLVAGEAVGAADPTKGFLNALSKGATAGGKAFVDARIKLEKESRGDGKKAIDAIKTLMSVETADLKLQQVSTASSGEVVKVLATWAKANNLKNQSVKKYSEITKTATEIAEKSMAKASAGYDTYVKSLILAGVTQLDLTNNLGKAIRVMVGTPKPVTEPESNQGASGRKPASSVKRIGTFDPRPKD
jgi:hypothetical protein